MSVVKPFNIPNNTPSSPELISSAIGVIVKVNEKGVALVDFPENPGAPIEARSTLGEMEKTKLTDFPAPVLLVFEQSDLAKPIITGFVNEKLFGPQHNKEKGIANKHQNDIDISGLGKASDAKVDGKKITFDAKEEILLRCGKSSILLRKDGKIVIKGANLVSRSSSTNKIKGSSVNIN